MYKLKKLNVIKVVNSKFKADKLVQEGFSLLSEPVFEKAVTSTPKPSIAVEVEKVEKPTELICPYCDKTYKSEKALMKHIEEKHSEE